MKNSRLFIFFISIAVMVTGCTTTQKVSEKLVFVHDTVAINKIDTVMVNQQTSVATAEQLQHLTQRIDSVIEKNNTIITLGENGDTVKIVQVIHVTDKSMQTDSVSYAMMQMAMMQIDKYKSTIDSLKEVNQTLLYQKEEKKKTKKSVNFYLLVLTGIMAVLCMAVLKSR